MFANSRPSVSNFKIFSQSLEQFFLTVGQINFGNKIPFMEQFLPLVPQIFGGDNCPPVPMVPPALYFSSYMLHNVYFMLPISEFDVYKTVNSQLSLVSQLKKFNKCGKIVHKPR